MYKYIVEGGHPVKGRVAASGNKNAALPCLAAAVLAREPVVLKNIPEIEDVAVMIEELVHLGAQVKKLGSHEWSIDSRSIERQDVPAEQSRKVRAALLFAGPLLAHSVRLFFRLPAATQSDGAASTPICWRFRNWEPE